jgi:MoxR-like ATPase
MADLNPFTGANAHTFVAMQVVPTLVEGMPGCGKTAIHEALATAMGRRFVPLVGSQCTPEDVGGLPVPDHVKFLCRMMPLAWTEALLTPGGFLFLDELTSVSPSVQAALLTVIQDKRVGDHRLDTDTLICAACNPHEITPNGIPLTLPTVNRFFVAQWEVDREAWLQGLSTLEWSAPVFPIVPADWKSRIPRWGTLVQTFLRRADNLDSVIPKDDVTRAFPTHRSWRNAVACLAAADAAGADMETDNTFVRLMVEGNVGEVAASQFVQFKTTFDLIDPLDLLDGRAQFKHREDRPDITLNVAAAVASAVSTPSTFTPERWDRAAAFMGGIGTSAHPEMALRYTNLLFKATQDFKYSPKAAALQPLIELSNALKAAVS